MSILIPSKNIYGDKQNKKVIDNKIKGIELNAVSPLNNKELKDYFSYPTSNSLNVDTENEWGMQLPTEGGVVTPSQGTDYFMTFYEDISSVIYKSWQGFYFEIIPNKHFIDTNLDNLYKNIIFSVSQYREVGELSNGNWVKNQNLSGQITSEFTLRDKYSSGFTIFSTSIIDEIPNNDNIKDIVKNIEEDYRTTALAYSYVYFEKTSNEKIRGYFLFPIGSDKRTNDILQEATYSKSSSVTIKMKIGELEEENITYKIGEETNFSIEANELLQTTATINNSPYLFNLMENISSQYALGKETATIRCSIGDYYDYNSGDKIISVDNSTGKMSFTMYDQVIPMVYGADGKDRPMSLYQDGTPKVFQVLGSKIFYDGAVWQELSLQEVDKTKIV
jgi:hypothetical protein